MRRLTLPKVGSGVARGRALFGGAAFALAAAAPALADRAPVPAPNPLRTAAAPAAPKPTIIGKVQNGEIVAFAGHSLGRLNEVFSAAEAAAEGRTPPTPARAEPSARPVASIARAHAAAASTTETLAPSFKSGGGDPRRLKAVLDDLKADRYASVLTARSAITDALDLMIVDYFLARSGSSEVPASLIAATIAKGEGWPLARLRANYEAALSRENLPDAEVIARLKGRTRTPAGARAVARALLAIGDTRAAKQIITETWVTKPMGGALQAAFAREFSAHLTVETHLDRADMLLDEKRSREAAALASRLGSAPRAALNAMVAAHEGAGNAARLVRAVPAAYAGRSGVKLAAVKVARRAEDFDEAARLIAASRVPERLGNAWWTEARIVARSLFERGKARQAYRLVKERRAQSTVAMADEAFHAGWIALTGLNDARAASRHFRRLEGLVSLPISKSRAHYWLGRAAKAGGNQGAARRHFDDAAAYGYTYYGQLARAELSRSGTGVPAAPRPSAADKTAIARHPVAEAVRRLIKVDHEHRIVPLLAHLGDTLPSAGQLGAAVALADGAGMPHVGLSVAKKGQYRALPVGRLAYPTKQIPRSAAMPRGLDRALVYAIARQESMFNPGAVSPVGARGLMQVMPRTASAMARELGLRHSARRLITDPAYNATLGAGYLAKRLANFDGSFILTFAAYNAGAGRVREWIDRFGDPRAPGVDAIQWVEQIPFPETRNYVMRVLENVQVYREALGTGRLAIEADLNRGRPS